MGPNEYPKVPAAIKIDIILVDLFENLDAKPNACGWKKLDPKLPKIIQNTNIITLSDLTENGIKIEDRINPQNINTRFTFLSAQKPNMGCNSDENMCEIVSTIVAIAIETPIFAAKNGIIGFKIPVYISFIKCPPLSQIKAFLSWDKYFFIQKLKIKQIIKSIKKTTHI